MNNDIPLAVLKNNVTTLEADLLASNKEMQRRLDQMEAKINHLDDRVWSLAYGICGIIIALISVSIIFKS